MNDTTKLTDTLKNKLIDTLGLADLTPEEIDTDEPLFGDRIGLDSIDALELVVMVEESWGIKIESKEVGREAFASIRALADFITSQTTPQTT